MEAKVFKYFEKDEIEQFGPFYKLNKTEFDFDLKKKNLILVTSITPTPAGEGKTTTLIGLNDCLNYFGLNSIACLRQPSMGPYFGIKGGATGSGMCELLLPDKINCGFTGDFYEIEAANNLIMAIIENEIYFNSSLNINPQKIMWKRCIDVNDRSLRDISYQIKKDINVNSSFTITAASFLMALFCLAKSKKDFEQKLNDTIIAFDYNDNPVYIKQLSITNAIMQILENALKPNLAFSKSNNPVIIHGGPFANIAHGCNSLIALNYGLSKADYVFTEAGFGSDLGAEKFLDILCRETNLIPNLVVLTITLKATIYHGKQISKDETLLTKQLIDIGFSNVLHHFNLLKQYGLPVCIVINKFSNDNEADLQYLLFKSKQLCNSVISKIWDNGVNNESRDVCDLILNSVKQIEKINFTYKLSDSVFQKIEDLSKKGYLAKQVSYSEKAIQKIKEAQPYINNFYVCGAKTQYSASTAVEFVDTNLQDVFVEDIEINYAARFIIPLYSKMFLMPGLPKVPRAKSK
ncbi:MAG: formate--tetrahydrofolate ligase [Malacoplasma sp.]|nr:formate--tetrahydrofolate ligase [Malacoplasma sp.]